ncbi:MAG: NAD(P)H-binding protein, partial [Candidatus Limnocylindrales bacterium]
MTLIVVFGATGGIGRHAVAAARRRNLDIRTVVRPGSEAAADAGSEVAVADITDADAVGRAVAGANAVVWAVGATRNTADQVAVFEAGARNLVLAMKANGVRRLVALSGAAITLDGERKPLGGRVMELIVKVAARHVYEAKLREFRAFTASELDWTLVRPPRVIDGEPTGTMALGPKLGASSVTQGDVGEALASQVEDRT